MLSITQCQARRFLLLHHGLLGEHRFCGKAGALAFVRQAGCIQFDPVDVCGRNAELTLLSRVKGMKKATLQDLLYKDRALVDYTDKQLAIFPVEDWPYFSRYRRAAVACGQQFEGLDALLEEARAYIEARNAAFEALLRRGEIFPVQVEGVRAPLYCRERDRETLLLAMGDTAFKARCEVIAPLDPMMWDRKLIAAIFGFTYSWEIYTPAKKRKYGYYVLPLVVGEGFAGRVEAVRDEKAGQLQVRHVWLEDGVRRTKKMDTALGGCMKRLARFNGCEEVVMPDK